jgi:predicted ABC-type ATPase
LQVETCALAGKIGQRMPAPRCLLIAGPNGAGKTTFAQEFLPREAAIVHFINADLIAAGLSPLKPELARISAARLVLAEMNRLTQARRSFAFESTLSGVGYVPRIRRWKKAGYRVEMVFLCLSSVELALRRVADRVRQGGHNVPAAEVRRRFVRGWANFRNLYCPLADSWAIYDNSGETFRLVDENP